MTKETIEKLNKIIKEVLGVEAADDLAMEKIPGWDSLRHIELIAKIERVFRIEINSEDTLAMTSLKSIKEILGKYVGKK